MIKKELCKKCWIEKSESGWIEADEERWNERGEVLCPLKYIEKGKSAFTKRTKKPPIKCPFFLEHIL